MRELSLNVLDIAQNSIVAGATLVELSVVEDTANDRLILVIADNGRGMTSEQLEQVRDPFYTTRTTRKVGMGIPLFRMAAEMAGGELTIRSTVGEGTVVTATFGLTHIDRMPLGDMAGTVSTLIRLNPHLDFVYRHKVDDRSFELDTRALREVLDDVPLSEPDVMEWINANMAEGLLPLNSQA
ncbi:MAG: sensor histidine kinase [Clostridia bacterium]|nr:sensor histidine kinase [Clostridia bacterium]